MTATPEPRLYQIDGTGLSYPPSLAICAPFRDHTGRLYADEFTFGRFTSGTFFRNGCRISFPPPGTDTGPVTIDEEFAFSEALVQAEFDVRNLIIETTPPVLLPGQWVQMKVTQLPLSRLGSAWIEGTFKDHIVRIGQHTGSKALATYIDSLKGFPYITRSGIPLQ
jgi:hypothetical protein